jgi:tetratricopeptide (TPR) repeat protein
MGKIPAIFIFDDFQNSSDNIKDFFDYFLCLNNISPKNKILILSRFLQFYPRSDNIKRKIIIEMELKGLDFESTKELMKAKGITQNHNEEVYKLSQGNPFFLESMVGLEGYIHNEMYFDLSEDERDIIGFLSILRFPILKNFLTVRDDTYSKYLPDLIQKSIVKIDTNNRYYVHDIIKQFFYSRLSTSQKLANHLYAGLWFEEKGDSTNLLEAIYHYQKAEEYQKASQIAIENSKSIFEGGLAIEFLNVLDRFDEKTINIDIWAQILILKGKANYMSGEWKKALLHFNFSRDLASFVGHKKIMARALCESGYVLEEQNLLEKAKACFKECLKISNEINNPMGISSGFRGIGRIHWRKEEYKEAISNLKKCLDISKKNNLMDQVASTYIDLGNVYDEMYELKKAIDVYHKSLEILNYHNNIYETSRAYANLAIAYRNIGEYHKAIELYKKQIQLAKTIKDMKLLGYGFAGIGYNYAKINKIKKAKVFAEKGEEIARKLENDNIMNLIHRTHGLICKNEKRWEEGIDYFNRCLHYIENLEISFPIPESHLEFASFYEEMNNHEKAKKHYVIAFNYYNKLGYKNELIENRLKSIEINLKKIITKF